MKVSIDGILGTAQRMNKQAQLFDKTSGKKRKKIQTDFVEIRTKINSRLLFIQNELKEIQSSLTKNQILKDGIFQLIEDMSNGGQGRDRIFNNVKFENDMILYEFVNEGSSRNELNQNMNEVGSLIEDDVSKLKRLQIEVENIMASNLVDFEVDGIMQNIESSLSRTDLPSLTNISNLKGNMVMSLIK